MQPRTGTAKLDKTCARTRPRTYGRRARRGDQTRLTHPGTQFAVRSLVNTPAHQTFYRSRFLRVGAQLEPRRDPPTHHRQTRAICVQHSSRGGGRPAPLRASLSSTGPIFRNKFCPSTNRNSLSISRLAGSIAGPRIHRARVPAHAS